MKLPVGFEMYHDEMEFIYGGDVFHTEMEKRYLDDIRLSLMDKNACGPDIVYSIAMDLGWTSDRGDLISRNLLYGACIYSKGRIGEEPVRSQGHIHVVSKSCNCSTPELYEILSGKAIICMQEPSEQGEFYAVKAEKGDKVLVPPFWPHYTLNALEKEYLVFGAFCVRDFGFEYEYVREHGGLSYFPVYNEDNEIYFLHNCRYEENRLTIKQPRVYREFNIDIKADLYTQYLNDRNKFDFISKPQMALELWENFIP